MRRLISDPQNKQHRILMITRRTLTAICYMMRMNLLLRNG
ncbi:hypothetical protein D915_010716 [Fasciola hepatica]|uniref:Uncharacterized protein n=1 Tax=Fasciola hepatica TaxID=6192 RepID=A0A4E0R994_FASHE|nr:hypothetical protein D915_010716 [Fasciola hepatica]